MGTHPIFESDFDCLTEKLEIGGSVGLSENGSASDYSTARGAC